MRMLYNNATDWMTWPAFVNTRQACFLIMSLGHDHFIDRLGEPFLVYSRVRYDR